MALLSLSLKSCGEAIKLPSVIVDDTQYPFVISVGDVYYMSIVPFFGNVIEGCFLIVGGTRTDIAPNTTIIGTSYGVGEASCEACLLATANSLIFSSCFEGGTYNVDITEFPILPTLNDTFLLDFLISQGPYIEQVIGCYFYDGFSNTQPNVVLNGKTGQTDCQTCSSNSPLIYEVRQCFTETSWYISFPSNQFEGHLITFTDTIGLTQYCGFVTAQVGGVLSTNATLISDLGLYNDGTNNCDDCLAIANEKKKLRNCLNPSEEIIVWASSLFQAGNSTHLSTANGCYSITSDVVPPSTPVDINELANFDPQQTCEDCLECFGLLYNFTTCEGIEVCNGINRRDTTNGYTRDFVIEPSLFTNYAYVTIVNTGSIDKIDLTTNTVIDSSPFSILYSPSGIAQYYTPTINVLCVTNLNANQITFFDANSLNSVTNVSIPGNSEFVYFNPNDNRFYVIINSFGFAPNIYVFSGSAYNSMSFVTSFGSNSYDYNGIVQVGSNLYVLNNSNKSIDVYDSTTYSYVTSYGFGTLSYCFNWDGGNYIYILSSSSDSYIKFNTNTNSFSFHPFIRNCNNIGRIHINTSTNRLYVTDSNCNNIYEFDTTTDTLLKRYDIGYFTSGGYFLPFGIASVGSETWFGSFYNLFQIECTNQFVNGSTSSNELLSIGNTFYNPELQVCCEITDIQSQTALNGLENNYVSMVSFDNCSECTGTTLESFYCVDCSTGFIEGILVAPQGQYNVGQFVKSHYGNSNFLCFEIKEIYDPTVQGTGYLSFDAENTPSYATCEECTSSSSIGLTLINCDTLVTTQVNVTLTDWLNIVGFSNFPNSVVSDVNGTCYQVANVCPIDDNNPPFEIVNFYPNQIFCRLGNRGSGLTSAGTEYFVCQICCPCDSNGTITSVSVPHPIWTNIQGNSVTLLDLTKLGGINGLNN